MDLGEQKFEQFLRGFEPVRPAPLPIRDHAPRRIAAAAVATIAAGLIWWIATLSAPTRVSRGGLVSPIELTRMGLDDPRRLEIRLDEAAPTALPCCEGPHSSLAALAKE